MNAPLAKPERGVCTSLSKAPAPRRDNLSLLQLFLPTPVTVRRLFIARGPSESQLGSSSHHVHVSEPHVHLHTAAFPIPFRNILLQLPWGCRWQTRRGDAHKAWERGARVPELLLPITTSSMNLALRFHQLRSLSKGFPLLGRQELVGGPPFPLRVRDGAANGEPPAPGGLGPSPVLYSVIVLFI